MTDVPQPQRTLLPNPAPIKTLPVQFKVLTRNNLPQEGDWVYIALTPQNYENLSLINAEVLRWIEEAFWLLKYYRGEHDNDNTSGG